METKYQVSGMSCGHCETAIKSEVSEITGVTGVQVSASDGVLVVSSDSPVDVAAVVAAVDEAGYSAVPA